MISVLLAGCKKGKTPVVSEKTEKSSTENRVETETLSYDQVVSASGKATTGQLYVDNSEPVNPGAKVDLIDSNSSPPQVIVSDAIVQSVRWRVNGPFQAPKYPASGFVNLKLTENQWNALKNKDIIIKPSKINGNQ